MRDVLRTLEGWIREGRRASLGTVVRTQRSAPRLPGSVMAVAETIAVDMTLDCTGLSCPMPILKTKKAIDSLQVGQVLKMIATDPGSVPDVNAWTRKTGNLLLDTQVGGGKYIFYLKKSA